MSKRSVSRIFAEIVTYVILVPLWGLVIFGVGVLFSSIPLGFNIITYTKGDFSGTQVPNSQIIFWATVFTIIMTLLLVRLIRNRSAFTRDLTNYIIVCLVVGSVITFAVSALLLTENTSQLSCDSTNTLERAEYALVPIETDIGSGTGFIVTANGYVVTAAHVVDGASTITAGWLNNKTPLSVVNIQSAYDLALLKLEQPTTDYINIVDDYNIADEVYALGWPANTFQAGTATISSGIISRILDNSQLRINEPDVPLNLEVIQTDAAVYPGNSGGPLINSCGVVGVVSAKSDSLQLQDYGIVSEDGISFAISSKTLKNIFKLK